MEDLFIKAGLTEPQAQIYLYLLEHGATTPPAIAKAVSVTRTNAYKVLDTLEDLGLVIRAENQKKIVYKATDPSALASLVANERNRVLALERDVKLAMTKLRSHYRKSTGAAQLSTSNGTHSITEALEAHQTRGDSVHFIKSRADVPFLGFDTMDHIRTLAHQRGIKRFGITQNAPEGSANPAIDERGGLTRTWVAADSYTAPVEWSVSGDELLIVKYDGDGEYIRIQDAVVADAFRQLWQVADNALRSAPDYDALGTHAKRTV